MREKYGVDPEQVPDFIALRGDPSDGLPGAKGIGPKTAADLLQRKGDLEHVILGAIREKPSVRRALIEQADELRSFKDIATLRTIPVERPPDAPTDYAARRPARPREHGMGRLSSARLGGAGSGSAERASGLERAHRALEQVLGEVAAPVGGADVRAGRLAHAVGDALAAGAVGVREQREQVAAVPAGEDVGAAQDGREVVGVGAAHEQDRELVAVAHAAATRRRSIQRPSGAGSGPIRSSRSTSLSTACQGVNLTVITSPSAMG